MKQNVMVCIVALATSCGLCAMEPLHKRVHSEGARLMEEKLHELLPEKSQEKSEEQGAEFWAWPKLSEIKDKETLEEALFNFGRKEGVILQIVKQRQELLEAMKECVKHGKLQDFQQKDDEFVHLGNLIKENI